MQNGQHTCLIEVKAERYKATTYVLIVLFPSVAIIALLGITGIMDLSSYWQWLIPPSVLSLIAYWHYNKHATTFKLIKPENGTIICSLSGVDSSIEEQVASMDYWNAYRAQLVQHGMQMHVVQYLQIHTISDQIIRLQSEVGEGIIEKSLLRTNSFKLTDRVYKVDDAGEIAGLLREHLSRVTS